ncbi:Uncharacterised protein [Chlamydia trachomatis]|nr:Uncharacterised protein [Chlamydia trachomatis]
MSYEVTTQIYSLVHPLKPAALEAVVLSDLLFQSFETSET